MSNILDNIFLLRYSVLMIKKFMVALFALLPVVILGAHKSSASVSYPSSLKVNGYGNYHSELIEPTGSTYHIQYYWTDTMPANLSASVIIENQDGTIKDHKLVGPTTQGGTITLTEDNTGPVRIDLVGGNWSLSVH